MRVTRSQSRRTLTASAPACLAWLAGDTALSTVVGVSFDGHTQAAAQHLPGGTQPWLASGSGAPGAHLAGHSVRPAAAAGPPQANQARPHAQECEAKPVSVHVSVRHAVIDLSPSPPRSIVPAAGPLREPDEVNWRSTWILTLRQSA